MKTTQANTSVQQPTDLIFVSCEDCNCPQLEQCRHPHPYDVIWENFKVIAPEVVVYLMLIGTLGAMVSWMFLEFLIAPGFTQAWVEHGLEKAVEWLRFRL